MGLNIGLIDFIGLLSKLQNCSKEDRIKYYDLIQKSDSVKSVLDQIKVDISDLITLLKLLFEDYPGKDIRWAIQSLNLSEKLSSTSQQFLKSIIMIDKSITVFKNDSVISNFIFSGANQLTAPKHPSERIHQAKSNGIPRRAHKNAGPRKHLRLAEIPPIKLQIRRLPRGKARLEGLHGAPSGPRRLHQHGPRQDPGLQPDRLFQANFQPAAQPDRKCLYS